MGGILQRPNRVRFLVKDLSNGKTFPILANEPAKYTLNTLNDNIRKGIDKKTAYFIVKHKNEVVPIEASPNQTLCDALGLSENGTSDTLSLMLEYIDSGSYTGANDWTLDIKSLTGNIIKVTTANPQELCVLGLKLLIQEESGLKPEQMRLIMDNDQLEDGRLDAPVYIRDIHGLINGSTIHLVLKN